MDLVKKQFSKMTMEEVSKIVEYLHERTMRSIQVRIFSNSLILSNNKPFDIRLETIATVFEMAGKPENSLLIAGKDKCNYQFAFDRYCVITEFERILKEITPEIRNQN